MQKRTPVTTTFSVAPTAPENPHELEGTSREVIFELLNSLMVFSKVGGRADASLLLKISTNFKSRMHPQAVWLW